MCQNLYYNNKINNQEQFSNQFSYRKRKRFALRSAESPHRKRFALRVLGRAQSSASRELRFASAVSKGKRGLCGGVELPFKKEGKKGKKKAKAFFYCCARQGKLWLFKFFPCLRVPVSLLALRSGVRFAVGFASLLAPAQAPVIGFRLGARHLLSSCFASPLASLRARPALRLTRRAGTATPL